LGHDLMLIVQRTQCASLESFESDLVVVFFFPDLE
jgi:hypothetical protein